jgi:hypothetical protein
MENNIGIGTLHQKSTFMTINFINHKFLNYFIIAIWKPIPNHKNLLSTMGYHVATKA